MKLWRLSLHIVLLGLLAACSSPAAQPEDGIGAGADWTAPGGAADEAGYSRLDQIDAGNVAGLSLAWYADLPDEVTLEATPLAVGGTLYFTGSYARVYAVDGATGRRLWTFDPASWKRSPERFHFGANRGVAYEDGRVFVAEMDGRVDALDAKTGKVLWQAETIPPGMLNNSTGAPRTMNGKVIIGNGNGDAGGRGFVTALDAKTGKQLWRFFLVPGPPEENAGDPAMEAAAKTWGGEYWKVGGGGGTAWNGMTFDPELDRIYIGAGNASPFDPEIRSPGGGDNLYTSSIVALDAKTGKYIWHYQETPGDSWDYKATPNIVSATVTIDGAPKKVLLHAPTNGFFYVLDRKDGKLIPADKMTRVNWASGIDDKTGRPVETENARYQNGCAEIWPGMIGGHNWQAMSYSPRSGLVYVPVHNIGTRLSREPLGENAFFYNRIWYEPLVRYPDDGKGTLVAWDPVAKMARWTVQHDTLWNGGTLATAGDLVFQGTADGWLRAYEAGSGKELWKFDAGLGIVAAPMSYSLGGKQYVSVLVGYGGTTAAYGEFMNVGWKFGAQTRRLITFALDGKAKLPAGPPADRKVHALDDPALKLDEKDVAAGRMISMQCGGCHGISLQSTGTPGPDLRESPIALDLATFRQFLKEGRMDRGMPRFDRLSESDTRQLHAYVRARAREALGLRPPTVRETVPAICAEPGK